jgi:hypothetical protein
MNGVNYASGAVPPDYRCASCGAHGCKLWRRRAPGPPGLLCAACAFSGDLFEPFVPAVPCEDGMGFWTVKGAPAAGVAWWKALPMALPMPAVTR